MYVHIYIDTRIKRALHARTLAYGIILRSYVRKHITEPCYGVILQNSCTESYDGIILRKDITELYHRAVLRQIYYGRYIMADILWQMYEDIHITAFI